MRVIKAISSMATRQLLAECAQAFSAASGITVNVESIGGVDAARRVERGEAFDVVVLASHSIDQLTVVERLLPGQRLDWVRSKVAVAVPLGESRPDISTPGKLRSAVDRAERIGLSTGPSGAALHALFARWGIEEALRRKGMTPPPGMPVAELIARREVQLGFQQLSEMLGEPGIDILGTLPDGIEIVTTFSAAVCRTSGDARAAASFIHSLADPSVAFMALRHGMELVGP